jgi:uncharacterized membrane protein
MATLYVWLKFIHILSVGVFLFVHGIAGGLGFLLRAAPVSAGTRPLLNVSRITGQASYPLLLLILISGIWMAFAGSFGRTVWPWAALGILIVTIAFMGYIARPYYMAREAAKSGDDAAVAAQLSKAMPELAGGVGALAVVLILALMVFKPF